MTKVVDQSTVHLVRFRYTSVSNRIKTGLIGPMELAADGIDDLAALPDVCRIRTDGTAADVSAGDEAHPRWLGQPRLSKRL